MQSNKNQVYDFRVFTYERVDTAEQYRTPTTNRVIRKRAVRKAGRDLQEMINSGVVILKLVQNAPIPRWETRPGPAFLFLAILKASCAVTLLSVVPVRHVSVTPLLSKVQKMVLSCLYTSYIPIGHELQSKENKQQTTEQRKYRHKTWVNY